MMDNNCPKPCGRDSDIVMQGTKIDHLREKVTEIRESLKNIEGLASNMKTMDLRVSHMSEDQEKMAKSIHSLTMQMHNEVEGLEKSFKELTSDISGKVGNAESKVTALDSDLGKRVSFVSGAVWAIGIVGALLYAILGFLATDMYSTVKQNDQFIETLKTLDVESHLKNNLRKKD